LGAETGDTLLGDEAQCEAEACTNKFLWFPPLVTLLLSYLFFPRAQYVYLIPHRPQRLLRNIFLEEFFMKSVYGNFLSSHSFLIEVLTALLPPPFGSFAFLLSDFPLVCC